MEIWAYSNCDEVELTVNGKRLGRQQMPRNGHLKWKATYQPGRIVATGYKNGKRLLTEIIETTKPAAKIVLKAGRQTIAADGRDVSVVTVEVQDAKGRIVPDACPLLTFSLQGDGRILGAGNGDPSFLGEDHPRDMGCHQFSIPAFNGLAQVLIQSGQTPGIVNLSCSASQLKSGSLNITAK